MAIGK